MESTFESDLVRGIVHHPEHPTGVALALTHGAGSNRDAPLLVRAARFFADAGYLVLRYDLPFRQQRLKGPPFPAMAARDRQGVVQAVAALRGLAAGRVIAGGHSYGGRQTAMAAAEQPALADALLLFSYPLHPPAKPEQKRTAFFPDLRTPALFVHGSDDPFGSLEELRAAIELIPTRTDLFAVAHSGHELKHAADAFPEALTRLQSLMLA
jgi:uncharacterized protein